MMMNLCFDWSFVLLVYCFLGKTIHVEESIHFYVPLFQFEMEFIVLLIFKCDFPT